MSDNDLILASDMARFSSAFVLLRICLWPEKYSAIGCAAIWCQCDADYCPLPLRAPPRPAPPAGLVLQYPQPCCALLCRALPYREEGA